MIIAAKVGLAVAALLMLRNKQQIGGQPIVNNLDTTNPSFSSGLESSGASFGVTSPRGSISGSGSGCGCGCGGGGSSVSPEVGADLFSYSAPLASTSPAPTYYTQPTYLGRSA